MIPQDLKFTKTHEWARMDAATGTATVGISEFAVTQLGDVVFIDLPPVGTQVSQDKPLGAIESVKAAVEIYAPLGGEVVQANDALAGDYAIFNNDPYGQAWIVRIKVASPAEMDNLLTPADYQKLVEAQAH